jgi:hypothetical protein
MVYDIDLTKPKFAYLFGLLQTDGTLKSNTRNRGCLSVELKVEDRAILESLQELITVYSSIRERTRDTNFKKNYTSAIWSVCDYDFRTALNNIGLPYGKKSETINIPTVTFSEIDYWRGILDGDGSLGLTKTKNKIPFLSLVTSSELLANAYVEFLFKRTGYRKEINPNKRDGVYNICILNEDAQLLTNEIYYPRCLCIDRKYKSAELVKSWVRPNDMVKRTWEVRKWTPEEDIVALNLSTKDAAEKLGRTEKSVSVRAYRLRKGI